MTQSKFNVGDKVTIKAPVGSGNAVYNGPAEVTRIIDSWIYVKTDKWGELVFKHEDLVFKFKDGDKVIIDANDSINTTFNGPAVFKNYNHPYLVVINKDGRELWFHDDEVYPDRSTVTGPKFKTGDKVIVKWSMGDGIKFGYDGPATIIGEFKYYTSKWKVKNEKFSILVFPETDLTLIPEEVSKYKYLELVTSPVARIKYNQTIAGRDVVVSYNELTKKFTISFGGSTWTPNRLREVAKYFNELIEVHEAGAKFIVK